MTEFSHPPRAFSAPAIQLIADIVMSRLSAAPQIYFLIGFCFCSLVCGFGTAVAVFSLVLLLKSSSGPSSNSYLYREFCSQGCSVTMHSSTISHAVYSISGTPNVLRTETRRERCQTHNYCARRNLLSNSSATLACCTSS